MSSSTDAQFKWGEMKNASFAREALRENFLDWPILKAALCRDSGMQVLTRDACRFIRFVESVDGRTVSLKYGEPATKDVDELITCYAECQAKKSNPGSSIVFLDELVHKYDEQVRKLLKPADLFIFHPPGGPLYLTVVTKSLDLVLHTLQLEGTMSEDGERFTMAEGVHPVHSVMAVGTVGMAPLSREFKMGEEVEAKIREYAASTGGVKKKKGYIDWSKRPMARMPECLFRVLPLEGQLDISPGQMVEVLNVQRDETNEFKYVAARPPHFVTAVVLDQDGFTLEVRLLEEEEADKNNVHVHFSEGLLFPVGTADRLGAQLSAGRRGPERSVDASGVGGPQRVEGKREEEWRGYAELLVTHDGDPYIRPIVILNVHDGILAEFVFIDCLHAPTLLLPLCNPHLLPCGFAKRANVEMRCDSEVDKALLARLLARDRSERLVDLSQWRAPLEDMEGGGMDDYGGGGEGDDEGDENTNNLNQLFDIPAEEILHAEVGLEEITRQLGDMGAREEEERLLQQVLAECEAEKTMDGSIELPRAEETSLQSPQQTPPAPDDSLPLTSSTAAAASSNASEAAESPASLSVPTTTAGRMVRTGSGGGTSEAQWRPQDELDDLIGGSGLVLGGNEDEVRREESRRQEEQKKTDAQLEMELQKVIMEQQEKEIKEEVKTSRECSPVRDDTEEGAESTVSSTGATVGVFSGAPAAPFAPPPNPPTVPPPTSPRDDSAAGGKTTHPQQPVPAAAVAAPSFFSHLSPSFLKTMAESPRLQELMRPLLPLSFSIPSTIPPPPTGGGVESGESNGTATGIKMDGEGVAHLDRRSGNQSDERSLIVGTTGTEERREKRASVSPMEGVAAKRKRADPGLERDESSQSKDNQEEKKQKEEEKTFTGRGVPLDPTFDSRALPHEIVLAMATKEGQGQRGGLDRRPHHTRATSSQLQQQQSERYLISGSEEMHLIKMEETLRSLGLLRATFKLQYYNIITKDFMSKFRNPKHWTPSEVQLFVDIFGARDELKEYAKTQDLDGLKFLSLTFNEIQEEFPAVDDEFNEKIFFYGLIQKINDLLKDCGDSIVFDD